MPPPRLLDEVGDRVRAKRNNMHTKNACPQRIRLGVVLRKLAGALRPRCAKRVPAAGTRRASLGQIEDLGCRATRSEDALL